MLKNLIKPSLVEHDHHLTVFFPYTKIKHKIFKGSNSNSLKTSITSIFAEYL